MYSITSAVKTAFLAGNTMYVDMVLHSGSTTVSIPQSSIVESSFGIDRCAAQYGQMPFGAAASDELSFTLRNYSGEYDVSLFGSGAYIDVTFSVNISGTKTTACEGGRFYIVDAPKWRKELSVTAYGCLTKADSINNRAGELYSGVHFGHMLNNIATQTGLTIDSTVISSLITTLYRKFLYPSGSDCTNRYFLGWIAALTGTLVREHGNADAVQFVRSESTGITINSSNRYEGGSYGDTITLTGVTATDAANNEFSAGSDGYRLEIDSNGIFDRAYNSETLEDYKQGTITRLWNAISGFSYTPCSYSILRMPFLECGDQISFVDDYGNTKTTVLTRVHITLEKTTIESSGMSEGMNTISSALPSSIKRDSISTEMIRTDALKSTNYSANDTTDPDFAQSGTFFNLANGLLRSQNFVIKSDGSAMFKGTITALAGYLGELLIGKVYDGSTLIGDGIYYEGTEVRVQMFKDYLLYEITDPLGGQNQFCVTYNRDEDTDELSLTFNADSETSDDYASISISLGEGKLEGHWTIGDLTYLDDDSTNTLESRLQALEGAGYATEEWVDTYFQRKTCLAEGTAITMFDGTTKNIEDVKTGDSILSYDPVSKTFVEAVVIKNTKTGSAVDFDTLMFDDGSHIESYGIHSFWREDTQNIVPVEHWSVGNHARKGDGTQPTLVWKKKVKYPTEKRHYELISSNNLYIANGIVSGHLTQTKYNVIKRWNGCKKVGFPAALLTAYETEMALGKTRDEMYISPAFVDEGKSILADIHNMKTEIETKQASLDSTDYQYTKGFEGFITALQSSIKKTKVITLSAIKSAVDALGDFDPTDRQSWRTAIDDLKPKLAAKETELAALVSSATSSAPDKGTLFCNTVHRANDDLSTIKSWASTLGDKS